MGLSLPNTIATKVDIGRLVRELASIDNFLSQAKLRQGRPQNIMPAMSRSLTDLIQLNKLDINDDSVRQNLATSLVSLQNNGLQLHISFASEPSALVVERVTDWFRKNVDPLVLLQIGLQPTLAAGCMVRTPNKVFDLSLRSYLEAQEPALVELIKGAVNGPK